MSDEIKKGENTGDDSASGGIEDDGFETGEVENDYGINGDSINSGGDIKDENGQGKTKHLRDKVIRSMLLTSLGGVFIIGAASLASLFQVRETSLAHSRTIGSSASERSQQALLTQTELLLERVAVENAALSDAKLTAIENQTRMTADIATRIYTRKREYVPRRIDYLRPEEVGSHIPYLRTAPGVSLASIRDEVFLAANTVDVLRQITQVDMGIMQTYVSGESGYHITVGISASGPGSMDYDARTRSWYIGAKETGGLHWSDPFLDAFGRGSAVTCAVPFYDDSSGRHVMKGIAGCSFFLKDSVGRIIDTAQIGEAGYAFLLDKNGSVVIGQKDAGMNYLEDGDNEHKRLAGLVLSRKKGTAELILNGVPVCAAYAPLASIDWCFCLIVPLDDITAPAVEIGSEIIEVSSSEMNKISAMFVASIIIIFIIIILTMLGASFTASALARSIINPIIALSEGARLIGEGKLSHRLEVHTGDEIEELSETFNKMINSIKTTSAEEQRIRDELTLASNIQGSMLPPVSPYFTGRRSFELAAKMTSAKEVGGDFYDFFFLDVNETKVVFVIADVSGKGVPAALFMVIAKTLIKQHLMSSGDPALALAAANRTVSEENRNNMFVTAFALVLDLETGASVYANAGHNAPLLSLAGGPYEFLEQSGGLPLGIAMNAAYQNAELRMEKGDRIYLYTDGVNEAMNKLDEDWGNERFLETANRYRKLSPVQFDAAIRNGIAEFTGGGEQSDDITTVSVVYSGPPEWEEREIPARIPELSGLQEWLDEKLETARCSEKAQNHLSVACEEVFVNIVSYAFGPQDAEAGAEPAGAAAPGIVKVFFRHDGGRIWLRFEDTGAAFDPTAYNTSTPKDPGGRGIRLVRSFTDTLYYERRDGRNLLTLVKNIV